MTHIGFILAAYLMTALVVGGLVAWIVLDGRAQKRKLAELEAEGIGRRGRAESGS
jgi:heme exporter protein D